MRIVGTTIPDNKRIDIALRYVFGVGPLFAKRIVKQAQVNPDTRAGKLTPDEINRIREIVEKNYRIENELKRDILMNIKRLKDISAYRGLRHIRGLPTRGQRTKTNSRTRRGNVRRTMGSGRKTAASPT
ncbi:30S ribosomal protein S13 [Patescibacteria group bacterium]|nr:30S ribosomal protein S13 [Patescibacteria group bacterium]